MNGTSFLELASIRDLVTMYALRKTAGKSTWIDKPDVKICKENMVMSAAMHQYSPQIQCTNKTTDIELRKLRIDCEENDPDLAYLNKKKGR
uniref:Uncharacterized protein n=1 Tax=Romanomermis culicivorax TaxID=13658 RepID=A0A915HIA9_ROMCU